MEELVKQVRRARWRLGLQRLLGVLAWCWFVTLLIALGLIVVDKFWPTGVQPLYWAAGALGVGLVAALGWIVATRRKALGAAIEIDRRFTLKERVSSALALPPEDCRTEAGQALIHDAVRRVERIDVATQFGVAPGKHILLPLLPALLATLAAVLISPATADPNAKADVPAAKKAVKKSTDMLRKKLADRQEQARKRGLKDAEHLFKKLQQSSEDLASGEMNKKKALVKLNQLSREMEKRRKQLGGAEGVRKQLEQLKDLQRGPADKFAKAVQQGDFQQAAKELKRLQQQIAKAGDKEKGELAKQLKQMQEKLGKAAESNRNAQQDLQNRIEQLRQAGQMGEANKLQEQLAKLMQQAPQMRQLDQLADQLAQCAECLAGNQLEALDQAMGELQANLQNLQQQLEEMEMLNDAMEQLCQARQQMNCELCGGFG